MSVRNRCATVSLFGLNFSCGKVSQAGKRNTFFAGTLSITSCTNSSARRLEWVTTKSGDFSWSEEIRNELSAGVATTRSCSRKTLDSPRTSLSALISSSFIHLTKRQLAQRQLAPTSKGRGLTPKFYRERSLLMKRTFTN